LSEERNTILIVDDEPDIRMVVQARLEAAGFAVRTAATGLDALSSVRLSPPDLILLDLMLPGMDGFSVCAMLKRDQRYNRIPIVMLTARSQANDRRTGESVGADAYLTKPFRPSELLDEVKRLLKNGNGNGGKPTAAADPVEAAAGDGGNPAASPAGKEQA
jgi:DNA-binding response OmpR family regulator